MPNTRRMVILGAACLIGALLLPLVASSAVITVRKDGLGDFATIADAVASATSNDTIEVGPGTYRESVIVGMSVRIISTEGASSTRVDGEGARRPFRFTRGLSIVRGISFVNGVADFGGAIRVDDATLRLRDCILTGNFASTGGGAVHVQGSAAQIDALDCTFDNNHATAAGGAGYATAGGRLMMSACSFSQNSAGNIAGALYCNDGIMESFDCVFVDNTGGLAGALYFMQTFGSVQRCTFYRNSSGAGATIVIDNSPTTNVTRNIFSSDAGGFGVRYVSGSGAHSCNLFWNNAMGPISPPPLSADEVVADPLFCDPPTRDLTLSAISPASAAMSPCGQRIGALPVSCAGVPIERRTWGGLKSLYRRRCPPPK